MTSATAWTRGRGRRGWLAAAAVVLSAMPAVAQAPGQMNPVYVDDSPAANDTMVRLREHLSAGNVQQGAAVLTTLLVNQPDRVIASAGDPAVLVSVRERVHGALRASAALLAEYRAAGRGRAERLAEEGEWGELERSWLLTPQGFDAALRLAQQRLEAGWFEAARRTLAQLDEHPDKSGERATVGALIAEQIARYIDRPEVWAWAAGWRAAAGGGAAERAAAEAWPETARERSTSPLMAGGRLDASGLVTKPLWTVTVNPSAPTPEPAAPVIPRGAGGGMGAGGGGGGGVPALGRELLVLPTASGDTVLINDGASVSAWDRFTLSPRWMVSPGAVEGVRDGAGRGVGGGGMNRLMMGRMYGGQGRGDDLGLVSESGGVVVAATGKPVNAPGALGYQRDLLDRVLGLDLSTGRTRWAVTLSEADAALAEASVRGGPAIVEGTVVVAARKYQPDRRLVSLSMVGIDLFSGMVRWVRPVGSAGSMPWGTQPGGNELVTVDRGVVYRMDRLGVIAAVEAHSGRTVWIRMSPVDAAMGVEQPAPWQGTGVVVDAGTVLTISPDGRKLLSLSAESGAVLGERDMGELGTASVRYVLRAGDRLVGVADDRLVSVALAEAMKGRVEMSQPIASPGIRGRVSVLAGGGGGAGDGARLLVPTVEGLSLYDPGAVGAAPVNHRLEEPGQVLALESQVIVADDTRLHSYLLWDVAERILMQRVSAAPADPAPAVTFAELAHRAGRSERIGEAVDLAMRALEKAPAGEATAASRARLLDVLQGILVSGLEGAGKGEPGAKADAGLLGGLVGALGRLAGTPDERVSHVMASGRLKELGGDAVGAAGEYQRVLDDAGLAQATWRGPQVSVRAELEATRRLEGLIKAHGAGVYAAQEALAKAELEGLGAGAGSERLEALVARFPLAGSVVGAYTRLAEVYAAEGKAQAEVGALEAGLRAARRSGAAPAEAVGELAGRLIGVLRAGGQTATAAGVLRTMRERFPQVALTVKGERVDMARLEGELAEAVAAGARWARVGAVTSTGSQVIVGATIMEPLLASTQPGVSNLLVLRSDEGVSAYVPSTAGRAQSGEGMVKAWSRQLEATTEAHVVRQTRDGAVLLYVSPGDGWVERIGPGPADGAGAGGGGGGLTSLWRSESLVRVFNREDSRQMRRVPGVMADAFGVPGEGVQDPRNVLVSMDERTIVVVQRSGRAAGIDAGSGEILWSGRMAVSRVADAQVWGGNLVLAGDAEVIGPGGAVSDLRAVVQVVDARTGRGVQKIEGASAGAPAGAGALPGGHPRWVRISEAEGGASVIVGLDAAVVSIDLATAQTNWTITSAAVMPTMASWLVGDALVLLGPDRTLWMASAGTGRLRPGPLEVPRTHLDSTRTLEVVATSAGGGFVVAGQQGLATFSAEGVLAGVDAFGGGTSMLAPRVGEGRAVAIETVSEGRTSDGLMLFNLHGLDPARGTLLDSRSIILGARPSGVRLLDDRVALTAGSVTVILNAPAR